MHTKNNIYFTSFVYIYFIYFWLDVFLGGVWCFLFVFYLFYFLRFLIYMSMFKSFNFCLSTSLLYMSSSHHKPIEFRIKQLRQDKKNHSMFLYLLFYWACLASSSPAPALAPSKEPCQTFSWRCLFQ